MKGGTNNKDKAREGVDMRLTYWWLCHPVHQHRSDWFAGCQEKGCWIARWSADR
jgi:hypothetical protein